jgi:hypothetical protein
LALLVNIFVFLVVVGSLVFVISRNGFSWLLLVPIILIVWYVVKIAVIVRGMGQRRGR